MKTLQTWADGPMCSIDTETTGTDPQTDRIVTATTLHLGPSGVVSQHDWLINPGIEIPEEASNIHGVTTDTARAKGVDPVEAVAALVEQIITGLWRGPLVVYNAAFDLSLIEAECRRLAVPSITDRCTDEGLTLYVVDPLVIDRAADKWRKGKRTLEAVATHHGITLSTQDAHTSAGDCLAAARVAWKLSRAHPKVGALSIPELMTYQANAHRDWADNFEQYLRKQGRDDAHISRQWPLRTETEGENQ